MDSLFDMSHSSLADLFFPSFGFCVFLAFDFSGFFLLLFLFSAGREKKKVASARDFGW